MSEEQPKRRLLSRWDWLWLIIVLLIIFYVLAERLGMPVVSESEKEELIEQPRAPGLKYSLCTASYLFSYSL